MAREIHKFKTITELSKHTEAMREGQTSDVVHIHDMSEAPDMTMSEHDCLYSRTTGRKQEISMGPHGGGLVPANPFASLAQAGYLHAHPEKLGKKKLAEFDRETKGMKLPKRVPKK